MKKNYYFMFISMLLTLLIVVTVILNNISKIDNVNINFETPDFNGKGMLDVEEELSFSEDVVISGIKELGNNFIAIGAKNKYPYMQLVKQENNKLVVEDISTNYTEVEGQIIDVIDNNQYITASILKSNNEVTEKDFFISNEKIIPYYKKQININYSKGVTIKPKYLVIHETANKNPGADAEAHYRYWSTNPSAKASTHFVVDSTQVFQMLKLDQMAWHVGDNKGYSDIVNRNSIGIEIAVNSDGNYDLARQHAIELTIKVMKYLDMDISQLKMHNDASGKLDPITMLDTPSLWADFVNQVQAGLNK